jgi:hypothetical protein
MPRLLFQLWFALWPFFLGVLEEMADVAGHHFTNLIWGVIDGLGLFAADMTVGLSLRPSFGKTFGFLVWPILISIFLFWLSGKLWERSSKSERWIYAGLLLLSGLCVAEMHGPGLPFFGWIPLYSRYLFDFT